LTVSGEQIHPAHECVEALVLVYQLLSKMHACTTVNSMHGADRAVVHILF
jgi:hypothetical protein